MRRGPLGLALALLAAGCAPAAVERRRPEPPSRPALTPLPPTATWRYHPRTPARMLARANLGNGRVLFAGLRGERWLYDGSHKALEAAVPAPEDLVAILNDPSAGRWFVGASGTTYRALTALGPFVEALAPFDPVARVSGAGSILLAVGRDGRLSRSADQGRTWSSVGPGGTRFVNVAVDGSGAALALSSPEALSFSLDGGKTFEPLGVDPGGALGLKRDESGAGIDVLGVLGTRRWSRSEPRALSPEPKVRSALLPPGGEAPLGADAGALAEGRAALGDDGYLEARLSDEESRTWVLVSGPLGGPLEATPLELAKGCRNVRLAAFGDAAYVACFRAGPSSSQPVELFARRGNGAFAAASPSFFAKLADFRMAAGAGGALLLSGVCQPSADGPGCGPLGVLERRAVHAARTKAASSEERFELAVSATPSLADSAFDLTFDADGRVAFAVGGTTKGAGLALFVSVDGGHTFEPRELGELGVDANEVEARVGMLSPASDGTTALVLRGARGTATLLVFDNRGQLLRAGSPPERALVGGAGLHALALGAESGTVWESLDGGASFQDRGRVPLALCPGDTACDVPVRCSSHGCVVGDELTRIGWGMPDANELEMASPVEDSPAGVERRLSTPIACVLDAAPFRALPGATDLPDAENTALGDVAWFSTSINLETASAVSYHAHGGPRPRVEAVTVLPPARDVTGLAFTALAQVEGLAVLRYRVPDPRAKEARLRDVEVGWDNMLEGRVVRQRFADGGDYVPGDFERGSGAVQLARPDLLSIGEHGIYLRVHAKVRERQPTLFLDGKSVVTLPPIVWPAGVPRDHLEMAHLGADHVGLAFIRKTSAVVRARREGDAWTFQAATVGLPDPEALGKLGLVSITYSDGRAALHVEELDQDGREALARVVALRPDGPVTEAPRSAPTQASLPAVPRPCGDATKRSSARVVAHVFPGARHPVVVTDALEPPRSLVTGDAVLFGSAEEPCAASYELVPVTGTAAEPAAPERGVLLLDNLSHAWLVRQVREPSAERASIEYRTMACRFEPNLEVPEEILKSPEALAPRR